MIELNLKGLENNNYLLFNPIVLEIERKHRGVGVSLGIDFVTLKFSYHTVSLGQSKEVTQVISLNNSKAKIRIEEAIKSIITPPTITNNSGGQEGAYLIHIKATLHSDRNITKAIFRSFIYGASGLSNLKHKTNLYFSDGAVLTGSDVVPIFPNFTTYQTKLQDNNLINEYIFEGINVQLGNKCKMHKKIRFRNKYGGVNFWIFNSFEISSNQKGYSNYTDNLTDGVYSDAGKSELTITLHSRARKELRKYIEGVIGSHDIQIEDLTEVNSWENQNVKGLGSGDWMPLLFSSCNIIESDKMYIDIQLVLKTYADK